MKKTWNDLVAVGAVRETNGKWTTNHSIEGVDPIDLGRFRIFQIGLDAPKLVDRYSQLEAELHELMRKSKNPTQVCFISNNLFTVAR